MTLTFHDVNAFRRCPYAYRRDALSGRWTISTTECMDLSVRDAVFYASGRRAMGLSTDADSALAVYWESWDRHFDDVACPQQDNLKLIKYGEQCVRNHIRIAESDRDAVVAAGSSEIADFGDGREILVSMDQLGRRGTTAVITRCLTDPVIKPTAELSKDLEIRLAARWALSNIRGCDRAVMRWELLGPGTVVECAARRPSLDEAAVMTSQLLAEMENEKDVLPRESEYCLECPYARECPRHLHELYLENNPQLMSTDEGIRLVDELAELDEKIHALKARRESLELRRDAIEAQLVAYSDAMGFMSLTGHTHKALIRHERKVEFPEDKTELVDHLKDIGAYDGYSMVNYPRLRSDVAKGLVDPGTARLAKVTGIDKDYLRKRLDRRGLRIAVFEPEAPAPAVGLFEATASRFDRSSRRRSRSPRYSSNT